MIPVTPPSALNEPPLFDSTCRQPGQTWLANPANAAKDPHSKSQWWSQFKPDLAALFSHRCGWLATSIILEGDVDHLLPCGNGGTPPSPFRHLAFEWENFRYASGVINSLKNASPGDVLDPCAISDGWFKVILPSFQLVTTDSLPPHLADRAETTLETMGLRRGHHARWNRWYWYRTFWTDGDPDIFQLLINAPLVGLAVSAALDAGDELPHPDDCQPQHAIRPRLRPFASRKPRKPRK
jgi:hypothetical protein